MSNADDRGSERLAGAVIARVTATHPQIVTQVAAERATQHFTTVSFTPPNAEGARLTLYANYDWSFSLHCGRFIVVDEEPMRNEDEDARVALVVNEIESIAADGLSRSRFDRLIGLGRDRVAPWSI